MPRVAVCLPLAVVNRADIAALTLQADNMITRFRDIIVNNPYVAIALSRIVAQMAYRLASERYSLQNDRLCFTIELTIDELRALYDWHQRIMDELAMKKQYYMELLTTGQAKNKTAVEQRVAAIEAWQQIIERLATAYRTKDYVYSLRG